jgi:hypothetical protein
MERDIERELSQYRLVDGFQCPAEFWSALGYEEEGRFVGIYWERSGDEASWADGRDALCGADWSSYLALLHHNFPVGHPVRYVLGTSEDEAQFWLVIDRETERAWLVPAAEAGEVLRAQWTIYEVAPLPGDSIVEWLATLRRQAMLYRPPSDKELEQMLVESQRRYEALVQALEKRKQLA